MATVQPSSAIVLPSRLMKMKRYHLKDWIKFGIPFATASAALAMSLRFAGDCRSTIHIQKNWYSVYTHASEERSGGGLHCKLYQDGNPLERLDDLDFSDIPNTFRPVTAQIGSMLVLMLGIPLWFSLAIAPCFECLNQVWPKLCSISVALVVGNLQLFTIIKFIRFFLRAFPPEEGIFYESRPAIVSSVAFWLLTAIAISLTGVKPLPPISTEVENDPTCQIVDLQKSASDDTKETHTTKLQPSISVDTHDLEEP